MKDYYQILELPFGAPSVDIKRAYHRLAFKYHPDKNFGNPVFEEKFKEVNEAYIVLSNDYKRIIYHAEYEEYLRGYRVQQTFHHPDPAFRYPRRPRARATEIVDEFKTLKVVVLILFVALIIFMLYESRGHMTEAPQPNETVLVARKDSTQRYHMSKDDYYRVIAKEYLGTKDTNTLKLNPDSMIHIIDSIMNAR